MGDGDSGLSQFVPLESRAVEPVIVNVIVWLGECGVPIADVIHRRDMICAEYVVMREYGCPPAGGIEMFLNRLQEPHRRAGLRLGIIVPVSYTHLRAHET